MNKNKIAILIGVLSLFGFIGTLFVDVAPSPSATTHSLDRSIASLAPTATGDRDILPASEITEITSSEPKTTSEPSAPATAPSLQPRYFGYFAGAMDGVGTGDYIPALSKASNLIFILTSVAKLDAKLTECEQYGVKAMVDLQPYFFAANERLLSNYKEIFDGQVMPIIQKHIKTVVAFYGLDEPYSNGRANGLSVNDVYSIQNTMGTFVKARFPKIPIGVIFDAGAINDNLPLFSSFDWFGFDCYSTDMTCQGKDLQWYYTKLLNNSNELARIDGRPRYIISVPQAGYPVSQGSATGIQGIESAMPVYEDIIKNRVSAETILVMPFLWQNLPGNDPWVGASSIPTVKENFLKFYEAFMARQL